jgi:hypothetical protein
MPSLRLICFLIEYITSPVTPPAMWMGRITGYRVQPLRAVSSNTQPPQSLWCPGPPDILGFEA